MHEERQCEDGTRALVERADNSLVQSLDAVLVLVADLGLALDDVPELEHVVLDLLNVRGRRNGVAAGHFLDVGLELTDVLADDLGVDDIAIVRDLGVRRSGEGH